MTCHRKYVRLCVHCGDVCCILYTYVVFYMRMLYFIYVCCILYTSDRRQSRHRPLLHKGRPTTTSLRIKTHKN